MQFDFETMLERHGMDSIAVDAIGTGFAPAGPKKGFDAIPMWVADMNYATCPAIQESVIRRVQHPAFGYFDPSDAYYDSIIRWQETRNRVTGLEKKHIGYENGVLGGVISTLNALCSRGDAVLLQSPAYIGFTHVLENNGYKIVLNPLVQDETGAWRLDYADLERKIIKNRVHAAIFCNPHNPCGRVWTPEEIRKAMDIFERHEVWVVSDEIWSDLLLNGSRHTPVQSVSDYARSHTAAFYAPSKTFNLAGLVGSYGPEGMAWVDQLRNELSRNVNYACDFIRDHFPGISVRKPEGTYMLFLHCEEWCRTHKKTLDELQRAGTDVGVAWQDGRPFYDPWGIRMNLALPFRKMKEAFDRLEKYVFG